MTEHRILWSIVILLIALYSWGIISLDFAAEGVFVVGCILVLLYVIEGIFKNDKPNQ